MWLSKYRNITVILVCKVMSIPIIIYGIFFLIRIQGFQPAAESGMGEFITALYFIFGASVSYFIFILFSLKILPSLAVDSFWWWFLSCFFLLLAFDEIYMIHENLGSILKVKEVIIFLVYGFILVGILFFNRKNVVKPYTLFFLFLFVLFSGISVVADTLFGEGFISFFGKQIDYEQLAETLSALVLSCAFIPLAIQELNSLKE